MLDRIMTYKEDKIFVLVWFAIMLLAYFISKVMCKKLSNKFKINYIKISFIVGGLLCLFTLVWYFYIVFNYSFATAKNNFLTNIMMCSFLCAFSFGIFMLLFGGLEKTKLKRYKLKQDNYLDYSNYIKTRVLLYNYELVIENKVAKFYKRTDKKKIYYIIDVKTDELKEETFEDFYYENILLEIEEDYELMKNKGYYLYITMIISVERITSMFYKYINSENVDERYYKYPVGVSFGSNQIYMAGEDGFKPNYCKKQKREIKEILEIEDKKKSD